MADLEKTKPVNMSLGQTSAREVTVSMKRALDVATPDQLLWVVIRNRTNAISFNNYKKFIDRVMCGNIKGLKETSDKEEQLEALEVAIRSKTLDHFHGLDGYLLLKKATEVFLMQECGIRVREPFAASEETSRLGHAISGDVKEVNAALRKEYLVKLSAELGNDPKILHYLEIIVQNLSDLPLKP